MLEKLFMHLFILNRAYSAISVEKISKNILLNILFFNLKLGPI
jgi:hypothetical protein